MALKKKIVIIDDEQDLCFLMKEILEHAGAFDVSCAYNGKDGQELSVREKPDLIFLDYVMPEAKGDVVLDFLRKNPVTKNIPVVIMSGLGDQVYFMDGDAERSSGEFRMRTAGDKDLGVAGYMPKPFSKEALIGLVKKILKLN